ncbi:Ig-like domain-containing protein [Flavobacterium quisquiliarum]|uniref:Ig-like domain-containing protein n=1 Tax=Flavobacterium quisquiliarum TaxID=1834436 RepID=A0ABV8WDE2_9FLAO|nr:tandem-95 repeat protein [Flavobacterium quisquiliarum]MBW1657836.1 tandem-95 repeat protein [Flavobacterium quisquiliarum]
MKKTLLLILFLLPFLGFSQNVELVKWDKPNDNSATLYASHITAPAITGTNFSTLNYAGFTGTEWPVGNFISSSTYIEIAIKADAGYKVDLASLKYAYFPYDGSQGPRKYQVRYSKESSFPSNGTLLSDVQIPSYSKTNVDVNFPTGVFLLPGETMYIRFYGYDRGNSWSGARWSLLSSHPDVNNGSFYTPTIIGKVSTYVPTIKANDDTATSTQNNFTIINVLSNDTQATNPISSVTIATPSANGTAVVNSDRTIKFTPTPAFTGATSFTYTIGDGTNTSTATVNVTLTAPTINPLVEWKGTTTSTATVSNPAAITGNDLVSGSKSTVTPIDYEGFKGTGWTTNFAKDDDRYFQVSATAKTGYKLKLNAFNFTYNGESQVDVQRYQVHYSKDNFATSTLLLDEPTTTGKVNKSLSLANLTLTAGETLTIRIYGYKLKVYGNLGAPIFLANSHTIVTANGNTVPTITGTVLNYDASDINANDDNVSTKKNRSITINALNNDTPGTSAITNVSVTQPASGQGTVSINPDRSFTFNPGNNFTGATFFTYTISNSTKSSTATVFINVEEFTPSLVIWNGLSQQPTAAVSDTNVTASNISATGMSFGPTYGEFRVNNIPSTLDYSKYVQVSVAPKAGYKLDLTKFKFTYNSPSNNDSGPKKYQVRYSTDPSFPGNGIALITETNAVIDTQTTVSANFPAGVVATQNQSVYIRLYVYDNTTGYTDYHLIHDNGGELGPTIEGILSDINTLTANYDTATTVANQAVTIPVLDNDIRGSLPLQPIVISTQSTNGTATVSGENIIFTPANGFVGETSFVYTLSNGSTYSSAAVFVTVTAPPCVGSTTPGINYWKGYVYTFANGGTPATTTYVGSVAEKANFDRNVGEGTITGDATAEPNNFCGTVPSNYFLVRYYMQVNISTEEIYNFTIGADDGVRLYIDGSLITGLTTGWGGSNSYAKYAALRNLTAGTHTFLLEYYENAGSSRVSFSYAPIKGDPALPFGDKKWNVYGFTTLNITGNGTNTKVNIPANSYAGMYVDPLTNVNSETYWNSSKSPSAYSGWQGAPISDDDFTVTYKRKGFPCGRYQIQLAKCDDVGEIYLNGQQIYLQNGYTTALSNVGVYVLNSASEVEIRLGERGGNANIAVNFVPVPTVYDGTGTPTPGSGIEINSNVTLTSDLTVCSCTVNPNYTLTVKEGVTLTVDEDITVKTGGKLLIESGGSLFQTSTSKNMFSGDTDSFEIQRKTLMRRYDATYWSMPVEKKDFQMYNLSPLTLYDKYFYLNTTGTASTWEVINYGKKDMLTGFGYSIRAPQTFSITDREEFKAVFKGIPNNGDINITVAPGKWNLIGNPYPSAISAAQFLADNSGVGTLYFWAHVNLPQKGADGLYHYNDDFIAVNSMGSIEVGNGISFDGYIGVAQGFIIKPPTTTIVYNNKQREAGNNSQFFKTAESSVERHRIWLNISDKKDVFKQILVGYATGATNTLDADFDAVSMSSNTLVDFYSINSSKKLVIQGRTLPFVNTDVVTFGYMVAKQGDYTISIDHADGIFNNGQDIYLEDKTTGKITNLRLADYTFTSAAGTFNSRFVMRYTNKTLGVDDFENSEDGVLVSVKSKIINVNSAVQNISEVQIYNIGGQSLYTNNKIDSNDLQISNLQSSNQVLLVKVILENGATVTKKIIFN